MKESKITKVPFIKNSFQHENPWKTAGNVGRKCRELAKYLKLDTYSLYNRRKWRVVLHHMLSDNWT